MIQSDPIESSVDGYCLLEHSESRSSYSVWLWRHLFSYLVAAKSKCDFKQPVWHPEHTNCVNWVWLYGDEVFKVIPVSIDLVMTQHLYITSKSVRMPRIC